MSRRQHSRAHKWSFERDTESFGNELRSRCGMNTTCTHPDTIHHQVDDPVGYFTSGLQSKKIFSLSTFLPYHRTLCIQLLLSIFHCGELFPWDNSSLHATVHYKLIGVSRCLMDFLMPLMTESFSPCPQRSCKSQHNRMANK